MSNDYEYPDSDSGEATIYMAMPSSPENATSLALAELAESLTQCAIVTKMLESRGWQPRWCDNPGDVEFFEFAFDKEFACEQDAIKEYESMDLGLSLCWDGSPIF